MTYCEILQRFVNALNAAIKAQESGELAQIKDEYDELDGLLPRDGNPQFKKLHIALLFWDSWIDARNHDWLYYEGITKSDWVQFGETIVEDLRHDHEISDERVLANFDLSR